MVVISNNLSGILQKNECISDGSSNNVSGFTVVTLSPSFISFIFLIVRRSDNKTSVSPVKHKKPNVVLCNLRGAINSPLFSSGVLIRRK